MPCLNEAETLGSCLEQARDALLQVECHSEIVVADNGSIDGSQDIARAQGARLVETLAKGYGNALRAGINACQGNYILMADSDGSYDFSALPRFLAELERGCQLVMGNRFKGEILPGAMPLHHRCLGNPVLSFVGRLLFRSKVGDFHCGIRAFEASAIRALNLSTGGMEFASEMIAKAELQGLQICEIPVVLSPDGRSRNSHLNSWRDGARHLYLMIKLYLTSLGKREVKEIQ